MDYRDFTVLVAAGRDGPEVRVLRSPAGERARAPFVCPLSEDDLRRLARIIGRTSATLAGAESRHLRPAGAGDDRFLEEAGERLFRATFPGPVRERLLESLAGVQGGVRIRLQLDLGTARDRDGGRPGPAAALHRIPWEILRWPDRGEGPVALDLRTPVVRHLELEGRLELPELSGPLGVLVVAPRPGDAPPLALDHEIRELHRTTAGWRAISLRVLERQTLEGVIEALRSGGVHVLHFMGHGELDPGTGDGALVLEDAAGRSARVSASAVVEQLGHYLAPLRLIFLNACRTAEAAVGAPWAGMATALARAGVPAVIAMQFPVTDRAAVAFASEVYERLAGGAPVDEAVTEGRLAIRREHPGSPEWATPALFLRVPDGRLFAPRAPAPAPARAGEGRRARLAVAVAGGLGLLAVVGGLVLWGGADEGGGRAGGQEPPVAAAAEVEEPDGAAVEEVEKPPPLAAALLGGRAASTYPVLPLDETSYVSDVEARVTVQLVTNLGREMVKVTVSPDGHDPQVLSGFPGNTLRFRFGGETLSVHLYSLDRDAGTVQVRVARSASRAGRP